MDSLQMKLGCVQKGSSCCVREAFQRKHMRGARKWTYCNEAWMPEHGLAANAAWLCTFVRHVSLVQAMSEDREHESLVQENVEWEMKLGYMQ
eukprot:104851-Pelagomonas_calceolata.AAC.5